MNSWDVFGRRQLDVGLGDMIIIGTMVFTWKIDDKYEKIFSPRKDESPHIIQLWRHLWHGRALPSRTKRAILNNHTHSTFHSLPVELLVTIAEYLPPVARLSMYRVCSKLRICLGHLGPEIGPKALSMGERWELVFHVRQDRLCELAHEYRRRCDERNFKLRRLGCSQCYQTHSPKDFSSGQLRPDICPKRRICAGLEGSVQLCEHFTWSAACLWRGIRCLQNLKLRCSYQHNRDVYGTAYECRTLPELNPKLNYRPSGDIELYRAYPLFGVDIAEAAHEALSVALLTLNGYICPHLRTSDPGLFNGKKITAKCPNPDPYYANRSKPCEYTWRDTYGADCIDSYECKVPDCSTTYNLRCLDILEPHRPDKYMYLVLFEVRRTMSEGPTHPSWRAQVVRDSTTQHKSDDCQANPWACRGLFCAGKYKGRIVTPEHFSGTIAQIQQGNKES